MYSPVDLSDDMLDLFMKYGLDINEVDSAGHTLLAKFESPCFNYQITTKNAESCSNYFKEKGAQKRTLKSMAIRLWYNRYLISGCCATFFLSGKLAQKGYSGWGGISLLASLTLWNYLRVRR